MSLRTNNEKAFVLIKKITIGLHVRIQYFPFTCHSPFPLLFSVRVYLSGCVSVTYKE